MKTIFNIALQANTMLGLDHVIIDNSTLNEYYDSGNQVPLSTPKLGYFGVGLGEYTDDIGTAQGIVKLNRYLHSPDDINVFRPMPLRFMLKSKELSGSEANKYRMKKDIVISGTSYVAYYVKTFNVLNEGRYLDTTTNSEGETVIDLMYLKGTSIKTPTPVIPSELVSQIQINHIAYTQPISATIEAVELNEMTLALALLYPELDPNTNIGEMLLISGTDRVTSTGVIELDGAQSGIFIELDHNILNGATKTHLVEIGGMELMKGGII